MSDKLLKVDIQKELKEFNLEMDFELKQGCLGILVNLIVNYVFT